MRAIVAATALLAVSVAAAQSPPENQREWPQEPTSFLGINFGQPIRASVVECPKVTEYGSTRYDWPGFGRPCFEPVSDFYEVHNIGPFFSVFASEIDGRVEYVSAKFNNGNAPSLATIDAKGIAAALTEKFGPPHSSGSEMLHNNAGATFEDQTMLWKGKNVEIDFDSVAGEYGHGSVCAYTLVYIAHNARQHGQQEDTVKGIL